MTAKPHSQIYLLCGVVVHSGISMGSGHYYSYIKVSNGGWFKANDSSMSSVDERTVRGDNAYILFYLKE